MMRAEGRVERFATRGTCMVEMIGVGAAEGLGAREWVYRVAAAVMAILLLATIV